MEQTITDPKEAPSMASFKTQLQKTGLKISGPKNLTLQHLIFIVSLSQDIMRTGAKT